MLRPDGRWQVGVGPGAVVLGEPTPAGGAPNPSSGQRGPRTWPAPELVRLASGLARSPAGLAVDPGPGRCAVQGSGPLARRLAEALGDLVPDSLGPAPSLTVTVHQHVVPPEAGIQAARSGRPTLPVVVQARRVVVGPATGIGSGPCLHCLDLHRRDRDAAWPQLAIDLGHPAAQAEALPVGAALARATEGLVLLLVESLLAGRPVSTGLAHELGPQAPHVVTRRWAVHPACPWHAG
jgi:hypothetical protein